MVNTTACNGASTLSIGELGSIPDSQQSDVKVYS